MPTITIDAPNPPRLGFITWTPVIAGGDGAPVPAGPATSVRIADQATFSLAAATVYQLRYDGVPGLGTSYVRTSDDCTDTTLRAAHAIDPATLQPAPGPESIADELEAIHEALLTATDNTDGGTTLTTGA